MRKLTGGLIVVIAVLALATSLVAAHDGETATGHDASDMNTTERGDLMKEHVTGIMGEETAESVQDRMDASYEEMAGMMDGDHANEMMNGEGSGMGCH